MPYQDLALPADIPWKRLASSSDMMDLTHGDRKFPPKWRSSVSVFYHEPEDLPETYCDRKVTYLKVVCSITGYQIGAELGTQKPATNDGWHQESTKLADLYHPCYGAILQVAISPNKKVNGKPIPLTDYPYIVDFEPKRRELYEAVTKSGEILGRSLSTLNVRKGATNTETTETASKIGAEVGVKVPIEGVPVEGKLSGEHAWKSGTAIEESNVRTTDDSREKRETYSHSTNLTQMYEIFTGYHLGSNRAVFYMVPRPHTVEEKDQYTFVNGPRRLEGIQEVFLVVNRPKDVPGLCVEAFLETAHLFAAKAEPRDPDTPGDKPLELEDKQLTVGMVGQWSKQGEEAGGQVGTTDAITKTLMNLPPECVLDTSRGGGSFENTDMDNPNIKWTVTIPPGFDFAFEKYPSTIMRSINSVTAGVQGNSVVATVELRGIGGHWGPFPTRGVERFSTKVTVYYKCPKTATDPPSNGEDKTVEETVEETVFLTSRGLSACVVPNGTEESLPGSIVIPFDWKKVWEANLKSDLMNWLEENQIIEFPNDPDDYREQLENLYDNERRVFEQKLKEALNVNPVPVPEQFLLPTEWVSFETTVPVAEAMNNPAAPAGRRVRATNELANRIGDAMVSSLRSSDRYPDRAVEDFTKTRVGIDRLGRSFEWMPEDHPENYSLRQLVVPHKESLAQAFGNIGRKDLMLLELTELQRMAGLTESEAREVKDGLLRGETVGNW